MPYRLQKTIVLVGMMGAGKTAVGGALAQLLGVEFRDTDTEIEKAANRKIAEIFERDGQDFFRKRETEILSRLLQETPCVLSTGGGAFLAQENRRIIRENGVSLWLRADLELLWSRVRHKSTRPLLCTDDPHQTLKELCQQREPAYAKASLSVTARPEYSIDDMAHSVLETLKSHTGILEQLP